MALTQIYTAVPNDVIAAARWNNEFGNIYNNGTLVAFPVTSAVSFNGQTITLDSSGSVSMTATSTGLSLTGGLAGTFALNQHIEGLLPSNNVADATNDVDITAGSCTSTHATVGNRVLLVIAARIKRLDAAWVTGTNQGGLSSSLTIGNNDYYIHAIRVGGVDDIGFDTSATAANLIIDHAVTHYRVIGFIKRVAGVILAFQAFSVSGGGLEYVWTVPTLDVDLAATLTTSERTDAVKVPLAFSVQAKLNVVTTDASSPQGTWIYTPGQTSAAPSFTAAPLTTQSSIATLSGSSFITIRTSSTGTIAARSNLATVDAYKVVTLGFIWSRRS